MSALKSLKKRVIIDALNRHAGNRTKAAEELKISIRGLRNLINEFDLKEVGMNGPTIEKLRKRSVAAARRMGFNREAEDIGQDVALAFIEKGKGQTVAQATVDAIRNIYGRTGGVHEPRSARIRRAERNATTLQESRYEDTASYDPKDGTRFIDAFLGTAREILESSKRAIVLLFYEWEFTEKEIGYLFGVTESRISQIKSELETRISSVMAKQESKEASQMGDGIPAQAADGYERATQRFKEMARVLSQKESVRSELEFEAYFGVAFTQSFEVESVDEASIPEWFA